MTEPDLGWCPAEKRMHERNDFRLKKSIITVTHYKCVFCGQSAKIRGEGK